MITIFTKYRDSGPHNPKKYKFDFMEESVKTWKIEHINRGMIGRLPYGILFYEMLDYYGEPIEDVSEWHRQREQYIDYLYNKYKR